jgi:hypothetical protein
MLWGLQMPLRQKFALGTLLSIGLVAVAGEYSNPGMDTS